MTKKAFTLIELLIVITIITILTASGVIYFFRQVSSMKLSSEIEKVVDIIDNFDSKINDKKILDYNFYFKKNSFWFTWSINNLWLDNFQVLNMNFETWTGIINSNSGTVLKIYSWIKFQWDKVINSSWKYSYNFLKNLHSKIVATLSWTNLNDLLIDYYSPYNLIQDNENKLELININSKSDKTWISYNFVEIKNLNWKKYIIPDWGSDIWKIYLFFEKEWVEKFIEIKK